MMNAKAQMTMRTLSSGRSMRSQGITDEMRPLMMSQSHQMQVYIIAGTPDAHYIERVILGARSAVSKHCHSTQTIQRRITLT